MYMISRMHHIGRLKGAYIPRILIHELNVLTTKGIANKIIRILFDLISSGPIIMKRSMKKKKASRVIMHLAISYENSTPNKAMRGHIIGAKAEAVPSAIKKPFSVFCPFEFLIPSFEKHIGSHPIIPKMVKNVNIITKNVI
nr:MAG TPA: hypothetical protein [Caudoviricetes sp.]